MVEAKSGIEETPRDDATTLEDQFGVRLKEECTDLEHPLTGWKADVDPAGRANRCHELAVGQGVRGREVDGTFELGVLDQEVEGTNEVLVVDPRHELPAAPRWEPLALSATIGSPAMAFSGIR